MAKDYYAILGVAHGADSPTIHSAFRALARQYHPDAGTGSSSSKFREALEAYHTLSDPVRRRQHDIDLGEPRTFRKIAAEPLFDPAMPRVLRMAPCFVSLDEVFGSVFDSLESEFEFWALFGEFF